MHEANNMRGNADAMRQVNQMHVQKKMKMGDDHGGHASGGHPQVRVPTERV